MCSFDIYITFIHLSIVSPDITLCGWLGSKHQLNNLSIVHAVRGLERVLYPVVSCEEVDQLESRVKVPSNYTQKSTSVPAKGARTQ